MTQDLKSPDSVAEPPEIRSVVSVQAQLLSGWMDFFLLLSCLAQAP